MNAAPDPAEIVAPSDPALYARRRVMGPGVWVWLILCVLCIALGAGVAHYGPTVFAAKAKTADGAVSAMPSAHPVRDRIADGSALPVENGDTAVAPPAAALAVSTLSEATETSRPFAEELAAAQRVLPPSPDLRALDRVATQGAPTRAGLAVQFGNLAGRAASASRNPGPDADLFSRLRYALSTLVSIRHVGSTKGSTPDAILARAQALLDDGDIESAVAALDPINDSAREVLAPWINAAGRRIEIDRHIAAIRADALAGLSRVSRGAPPVDLQAQP
jgi:hypothetical protein